MVVLRNASYGYSVIIQPLHYAGLFVGRSSEIASRGEVVGSEFETRSAEKKAVVT